MYEHYFGLSERPFSITAHPHFFFGGAERGVLLDGLVYALEQGEGIIKVCGEVGTGKTMLCRMLIEAVPKSTQIVYLVNPRLTPKALLGAIAIELGLNIRKTPIGGLIPLLQRTLIDHFAAGRRVVVLIDEAHAMPPESLEEIRLLSNLETGHYKLLQIVLFGQPELDEMLAHQSMRQLRERITYSFDVRPLSAEESAHYINFRMQCAGWRDSPLFSPRALAEIAKISGGLTRRINILADKCLLAAFVDQASRIELKHVRTAAADAHFSAPPHKILRAFKKLLFKK